MARRLMAMRPAAALALAALLLPLAGCSGPDSHEQRVVRPADVGYEPSSVHVSGTQATAYEVTSWDGTVLSAAAVVPITNDTVAGAKPTWPLVVFLHGWGGDKSGYAGQQELFAQAGLVTVAYDARGFGASGGQATVAGKAEESDLAAIIQDAQKRFHVGLVGVIGQSYGAGQALLAIAHNPTVATVVSQYGWTDLADGLIPGNVPKVWWAQTLYGYGLVGSKARYDPMIQDWYQHLYTRQDLATVRKQMQERSVGAGLSAIHKPLLLCQGLQETLFPQADRAWSTAAGFTRAYVYQGGHGGDDAGCWSRTLDWCKFFLGGYDTRVDAWPALETQDAAGASGLHAYATFPAAVPTTLHLRGADLVAEPSSATFEIRQTVLGNPALTPSALWDQSGMPNPFLPDEVRTNPTSVSFALGLDAPRTLVGAPTVQLHVASGDSVFQVTGTLLRVRPDGTSQDLGHGAVAALSDADAPAGNVTLRFPWTHATFDAGDHLVLRLSSNDETYWMPLLDNYAVAFDGTSSLWVPWAAA